MDDPKASVEIHAPIEQVWAVMVDTASYGEWNPFVEKAECALPPKVGEPIVLHVRWANGRTTTSPERITVVDPPHEQGGVRRAMLAYVYEGLPSKLGLVKGTRYQRLWQQPGGPTHYGTVEEFSGPLVRLAGSKRVEDGFRRHADALKKRCEG
jgi:hypothetical protein